MRKITFSELHSALNSFVICLRLYFLLLKHRAPIFILVHVCLVRLRIAVILKEFQLLNTHLQTLHSVPFLSAFHSLCFCNVKGRSFMSKLKHVFTECLELICYLFSIECLTVILLLAVTSLNKVLNQLYTTYCLLIVLTWNIILV